MFYPCRKERDLFYPCRKERLLFYVCYQKRLIRFACCKERILYYSYCKERILFCSCCKERILFYSCENWNINNQKKHKLKEEILLWIKCTPKVAYTTERFQKNCRTLKIDLKHQKSILKIIWIFYEKTEETYFLK